jgi:hypothetical protein
MATFFYDENLNRELPAFCQSEILTSFKDCVWLITLEDIDTNDQDYPWNNLLSDGGKMTTKSFLEEKGFCLRHVRCSKKGEINAYVSAIKNIAEIYGERTLIHFDKNWEDEPRTETVLPAPPSECNRRA